MGHIKVQRFLPVNTLIAYVIVSAKNLIVGKVILQETRKTDNQLENRSKRILYIFMFLVLLTIKLQSSWAVPLSRPIFFKFSIMPGKKNLT